MKLVYCFLVSSLLGFQICQAQIPIKIKAGAARSNLHPVPNSVGSYGQPVITWYGGVSATFRMGKRYFFQPELLLSKRAFRLERPWTSKIDHRYGYISMPLLVGWHPFKKMSLLIGAEPGYMIWDRAKDNADDPTYLDVDRRFNVDIELGLAYQVLPRWTVEVRGMAGMIALYERWREQRASVYKTGEYEGYHRIIQLGLSYDLKIKKK